MAAGRRYIQADRHQRVRGPAGYHSDEAWVGHRTEPLSSANRVGYGIGRVRAAIAVLQAANVRRAHPAGGRRAVLRRHPVIAGGRAASKRDSAASHPWIDLCPDIGRVRNRRTDHRCDCGGHRPITGRLCHKLSGIHASVLRSQRRLPAARQHKHGGLYDERTWRSPQLRGAHDPGNSGLADKRDTVAPGFEPPLSPRFLSAILSRRVASGHQHHSVQAAYRAGVGGGHRSAW